MRDSLILRLDIGLLIKTATNATFVVMIKAQAALLNCRAVTCPDCFYWKLGFRFQ